MEQEAKTIVEELQEAGVMPELDKVSTAEESVSDEDETSSPLDKSVEGDDDSDSIQDGKVNSRRERTLKLLRTMNLLRISWMLMSRKIARQALNAALTNSKMRTHC